MIWLELADILLGRKPMEPKCAQCKGTIYRKVEVYYRGKTYHPACAVLAARAGISYKERNSGSYKQTARQKPAA